MPNIKSAVKRVKTSMRNRMRNRSVISRIKTTVKQYRAALAGGGEKPAELLNRVYKNLDKAATKGIIHRNKAARVKSRLSRELSSAS